MRPTPKPHLTPARNEIIGDTGAKRLRVTANSITTDPDQEWVDHAPVLKRESFIPLVKTKLTASVQV